MPRLSTFTVPVETSLFTPLQAQPRALVGLLMSSWAHWLQEHLVSFPRMIRDHRAGAVVIGVELTYLEALAFVDAEVLEVDAGLTARRGGRLFALEVTFRAAGRTFARGVTLGRTVLLDEATAMVATPGALPPALLDRFQPDERIDAAPPRPLPALLAALEAMPLVAERSEPLVLRRHQCEVADQWSFVEVPALAAAGREQLALAEGGRVPALREGLARPLRRLDVEYSRPMFAFESGEVQTRVHQTPGGPAFVHRVRTTAGGVHATIVEQLG